MSEQKQQKQPTKVVAARGLNFVPVGKNEEVRVEAGEPVVGMPKAMLAKALENGKVVAAGDEGKE